MAKQSSTTRIPVVPLRTPTHTGSPTEATLSRQWIIFFEQIAGALSGIGVTPQTSPGAITLAVSGTLGIGSDQAPRVAPLVDTTASAVVALVKTAPTGADLVMDISYYASSAWTVWMTLDLVAGTTSVSATAAQLGAAGVLPAGAPVRLDITACGTTFPGADLTVQVFS